MSGGGIESLPPSNQGRCGIPLRSTAGWWRASPTGVGPESRGGTCPGSSSGPGRWSGSATATPPRTGSGGPGVGPRAGRGRRGRQLDWPVSVDATIASSRPPKCGAGSRLGHALWRSPRLRSPALLHHTHWRPSCGARRATLLAVRAQPHRPGYLRDRLDPLELGARPPGRRTPDRREGSSRGCESPREAAAFRQH